MFRYAKESKFDRIRNLLGTILVLSMIVLLNFAYGSWIYEYFVQTPQIVSPPERMVPENTIDWNQYSGYFEDTQAMPQEEESVELLGDEVVIQARPAVSQQLSQENADGKEEGS